MYGMCEITYGNQRWNIDIGNLIQPLNHTVEVNITYVMITHLRRRSYGENDSGVRDGLRGLSFKGHIKPKYLSRPKSMLLYAYGNYRFATFPMAMANDERVSN